MNGQVKVLERIKLLKMQLTFLEKRAKTPEKALSTDALPIMDTAKMLLFYWLLMVGEQDERRAVGSRQ